MNTKLLLACVGAVVTGATASFAQTPVGPFTGQHSEGFDGPQQTTFAPCLAYRVFDNTPSDGHEISGKGLLACSARHLSLIHI